MFELDYKCYFENDRLPLQSDVQRPTLYYTDPIPPFVVGV